MLELLISSSFRRSSSSALNGGETGSYCPAGSIKFLVLNTGLLFFLVVCFFCFFVLFFPDNCHMTFSQHLQLSFFHQIKACDCITFSGKNKLSPSSSRQEHRGLLSVRYPMEHGIVTDWNDMERIWQYVYSKEQLQTFSEEHPVLLTEAPLNPSKNREKAAEVFFETFNVPALFISMQAVLSLYATGRTTGVVLDSGDGVTHVVPIYEGFAIPHSIMRVDIAGRDVSRYLRLLLRKEGYNFNTSAEFEVVRTIKERACYLSLNPQKDETLETEKAQYVLPDGSTLNIGPARFRAPELLFRPDLIGDESSGIHEVLAYAIQKSDMDLRRTLFSTIVLCGGSTLIKGFGERLLTEVKKLAPKDVKIKISAPQERLYSTWIGGSILASLDTFKKMWVSKREYEEDRARAIHRKTF
uniref:Actin related protein 1B n=1 Tax=Haplochromis burtoni TaxID=8153 RepID=A0A3Q3CAB7_HAPBU